jgi:hypothetical protein
MAIVVGAMVVAPASELGRYWSFFSSATCWVFSTKFRSCGSRCRTRGLRTALLHSETNRGNTMKATTALATAILILLPGAIVPAGAQEHEREKQPEEKQQQAKPAQHQRQAKRANHAQAQHPQGSKSTQRPQRAAGQPQSKSAQQHSARQQQAKPSQQPQRGQESQRTSRAQPAAGRGRIPEDRFRASFGRAHTFHVNRSEFANGSGRFQYGGFWFNAVAPWPVGWLYTDNVYVDYLNGGYFLCNPLHPGVYISVNIG